MRITSVDVVGRKHTLNSVLIPICLPDKWKVDDKFTLAPNAAPFGFGLVQEIRVGLRLLSRGCSSARLRHKAACFSLRRAPIHFAIHSFSNMNLWPCATCKLVSWRRSNDFCEFRAPVNSPIAMAYALQNTFKEKMTSSVVSSANI